jgi:1,4-alpha-glucan branching enzyme
MLFMGEEWNACQPFLFFSDFSGDLAEAVRRGRRQEFSRFPEFQDPQRSSRIPDPQSIDTFRASKLNWQEASLPEHAAWLDWYRRILKQRRETIAPLIPQIGGHAGRYEVLGDGAILVRWLVGAHRELALAANLSDTPIARFPSPTGSVFWREGDPSVGAPWSVVWWQQ